MPSSPEEKGFGQADPALRRWAEQVFQPEDEVLREIRERSIREGLPAIAVGNFDGLHLEVLARATGALKAVEIGTLGGYSGVCLLRGMGPHGVLHTFEFSEKHARVASASFHKAGVAARAHIHVGPAATTLREITAEAPFDLVFIDADKESIPDYFALALRLTRAGSLIVVDNVVRGGAIADPKSSDSSVIGLRRFNEIVAAEPRVTAAAIQTVGAKGYDGLALVLVTSD